MSNELTLHRLLDGTEVATGLNMPTLEERLLMANVAELPETDEFYWVDKAIQDALVRNGQQRYIKDREARRYRMRNQARLGKCNGSSNADGIEQLREGQGMPKMAMSDCYVYSLANDGRDQGCALITTLTQLQAAGGTSPMELQIDGVTKVLPNDFYNRRQVDKRLLQQADIEAKRFVGWEFYKAPVGDFAKFCRALATAIARKDPIIFAWHVGSSSMSLRNGYVQVGRGPGNHSNIFHSGKWVGGKELVHPDDKNSWGPSVDPLYGPTGGQGWGDGGYALFTMEDAYACADNHCCYIMTSMRADPNDPAIA